MDIEKEELKLMNRKLEQYAERDRLINGLRFNYKRPEYRTPHRCIVCKGIMYHNSYEKVLYVHIIHFGCGKALRQSKKQKKHTLTTLLKYKGITIHE